MKSFKDKVAVITGAGSGIGRALAQQLAGMGATVALNDWNAENVRETLHQVEKAGGSGWASVFDVADRDAVFKFASEVGERFGKADIAINNAGVGLPLKPLQECTMEDFDHVFRVNLWGVVHGTQAFLPELKKRPEASLVNISSVFGLSGYPQQGPYVMTKFAVRGFTETLRQELKDSPVTVSCVHPGGIKTNIVRNTEFEDANTKKELIESFNKMAPTSAGKAAAVIIGGIQQKKPRILIGSDAGFLDAVVRLFPGTYERILQRRFRT